MVENRCIDLHILRFHSGIFLLLVSIFYYVQGLAKKLSLGCVIPAPWSALAAGARFTQPRDHSLADPCTYEGKEMG